ncbi:MAG: hypothetical protein M1819_007373 [Sarea resinae]|nr:MAG: hypothetical protein M1819_007373 [Sarea resinae]
MRSVRVRRKVSMTGIRKSSNIDSKIESSQLQRVLSRLELPDKIPDSKASELDDIESINLVKVDWLETDTEPGEEQLGDVDSTLQFDDSPIKLQEIDDDNLLDEAWDIELQQRIELILQVYKKALAEIPYDSNMSKVMVDRNAWLNLTKLCPRDITKVTRKFQKLFCRNTICRRITSQVLKGATPFWLIVRQIHTEDAGPLQSRRA